MWIRGTVRKITQDMVYVGSRVHGRITRSRVGLSKKYRPEEEWKIIENAHPAIIQKELFDMVQKVNYKELEKRRNYAERNDFRTTTGSFSGDWFIVRIVTALCRQEKAAHGWVQIPQAVYFMIATPIGIPSIYNVQAIMSGRRGSILLLRMQLTSK